MSYLDNSNKNLKEGLTYNQLSTGKFKDSGDPDKVLTLEEKKLFERDLNIVFNNFIEAVADNRKLSIPKVKQMADGSTMLGEAALKNGLIDRIGDIYTIKDYLKEKIGEDVEIC
jgi:protease-4